MYVCSKSIYTGCPKNVPIYMSYSLFEGRTSINGHICMLLFRLDMRVSSISEIRGMFFFSSCDIFETFCILYRSLFHFPLRLLLVSLKCISVGTISRSCLPSVIVIEIFTCLQDTEKSRFVSANREASALFLYCA